MNRQNSASARELQKDYYEQLNKKDELFARKLQNSFDQEDRKLHNRQNRDQPMPKDTIMRNIPTSNSRVDVQPSMPISNSRTPSRSRVDVRPSMSINNSRIPSRPRTQIGPDGHIIRSNVEGSISARSVSAGPMRRPVISPPDRVSGRSLGRNELERSNSSERSISNNWSNNPKTLGVRNYNLNELIGKITTLEDKIKTIEHAIKKKREKMSTFGINTVQYNKLDDEIRKNIEIKTKAQTELTNLQKSLDYNEY